jgi:hypothetical protein
MLLREVVRAAANDDGSPILVETWVMLPEMGTWLLVAIRPLPDVEAALARAPAAG